VELELTPKVKRPAGEPRCEPAVYPDVQPEPAIRMAAVAKALGDGVPVTTAPGTALGRPVC